MPIDLTKFSEPVEVIVPIINGEGVYRRRKIKAKNGNGFYYISFGDGIDILGEAVGPKVDEMLTLLPVFRGISYGNSLIPLNFATAKFLGYSETNPCYFMNCDLGMIIKTRVWEDGKLFFESVDWGSSNQILMVEVKRRANEGIPLEELKGVTPEMRYFYLLVSLDKQRFKEWQEIDKLNLSKAEKEKRIEEFKKTFSGRLQKAVEDAGGKLVRFTQRGNNVDIVWKVGGQTLKSVANQDFRILELGYCTNSHDKDHSISSAVLLAKQFQDDGLLYITRQ